MTGVMERPAIFGYCHGWQVVGQCLSSGAVCREDMDDFNKPNVTGLDLSFSVYQKKFNHYNKKRQPEFGLAQIFYRNL